MTELATLLAELERLRVRLTLDGAMLRVAAPKGAVTPALAEAMKARKNELIAHLRLANLPPDRRAAAEAEGDGGVRVSPGQRRILSAPRTREADAAFHVPTVFRLDGPLDREALRASLADLARRHDALRSAFTEAGGRSFVRVTDPVDVPLPVDDLAPDLDGLDDAARDRTIAERAAAEVRRAFDLVRGPPWRARLLALGPRAHVLVLTMHHVVFDGRSKPVYLDELAECYRARVDGRAPSLLPAPPFADYASWQRRVARDADASGHIDYWRQTFAGLAEPTELPVDRPRRARTAGSARHRHFELDAPTAQRLRALARREQASPYIVLLAAFVALLHGRSGQRDLVVCSPFASRERAGFERMIGYLNTLVLAARHGRSRRAFDDLVPARPPAGVRGLRAPAGPAAAHRRTARTRPHPVRAHALRLAGRLDPQARPARPRRHAAPRAQGRVRLRPRGVRRGDARRGRGRDRRVRRRPVRRGDDRRAHRRLPAPARRGRNRSASDARRVARRPADVERRRRRSRGAPAGRRGGRRAQARARRRHRLARARRGRPADRGGAARVARVLAAPRARADRAGADRSHAAPRRRSRRPRCAAVATVAQAPSGDGAAHAARAAARGDLATRALARPAGRRRRGLHRPGRPLAAVGAADRRSRGGARTTASAAAVARIRTVEAMAAPSRPAVRIPTRDGARRGTRRRISRPTSSAACACSRRPGPVHGPARNRS